MKKICGIDDKMYWIVEYNEYSIKTLIIDVAFDENGNYDFQMEANRKFHGLSMDKVYFGTPLSVISDIAMQEKINAYLTPDHQKELLNLLKK